MEVIAGPLRPLLRVDLGRIPRLPTAADRRGLLLTAVARRGLRHRDPTGRWPRNLPEPSVVEEIEVRIEKKEEERERDLEAEAEAKAPTIAGREVVVVAGV